MRAILLIRDVRIEKKMTQKQLAELVPISQSYLSELECNKKNPTLQLLCNIAEALSVDPSKLVHYV